MQMPLANEVVRVSDGELSITATIPSTYPDLPHVEFRRGREVIFEDVVRDGNLGDAWDVESVSDAERHRWQRLCGQLMIEMLALTAACLNELNK